MGYHYVTQYDIIISDDKYHSLIVDVKGVGTVIGDAFSIYRFLNEQPFNYATYKEPHTNKKVEIKNFSYNNGKLYINQEVTHE